MNPYTGHLKTFDSEFPAPEEFEPLTEELRESALKALDGKAETHIDLGGGSDLARWAAEKRKQKSRRRNGIAKESRKKNRG